MRRCKRNIGKGRWRPRWQYSIHRQKLSASAGKHHAACPVAMILMSMIASPTSDEYLPSKRSHEAPRSRSDQSTATLDTGDDADVHLDWGMSEIGGWLGKADRSLRTGIGLTGIGMTGRWASTQGCPDRT
jgi:hypothetical protein